MQTQNTPRAEVDAHIALDQAMEPFTSLTSYSHDPMPYQKGDPHIGALLALDGRHGITAQRWDSPERPETVVTLTSPGTHIALSWSRNEATGVDNGWRLDSVTWPGVSTWPGRRYRRILGAFDTLKPLSATYPPQALEGIPDDTAGLDPATAASKVTDLALYKGSRTRPLDSDPENFPDVQAWIAGPVMQEAAAAVMEAQPWESLADLDAVVRPILDQAWPVAAR